MNKMRQLKKESLAERLLGAALAGVSLLGMNNVEATPLNEPAPIVQTIPYESLDYKTLFVAKVIYSEAGPTCSNIERILVAKTIGNRLKMKKIDFPRDEETAYGIVNANNAFSVVKHPNENWSNFNKLRNTMPVQQCISLATELMKNDKINVNSVDCQNIDDIVYFHDNSLKEAPAGWTNKYWRPVVVKKTKNFTFYKIVSNVKN